MKKIVTIFLLILATSLMVVAEADAARLGGGRSFGRYSPGAARQAPMQRQAAKPQQQQAAKPQQGAAANQAAAPRPSPWRGILGGALLGLGLGALLSHFGIGGGLASMISTILMVALIGFAIMFIYRMFTKKKETQTPATAYSGHAGSSYGGGYGSNYGSAYNNPPAYPGGGTPEIGSGLQQPTAVDYVPYGVPGDFDVAAFIRSAKTHFIRLQAAWDRADIDDIREFTSPEMFAELRMQLQERGASPNDTDVVTLNAALLGIEEVNNLQMASVQFTGTIREAKNAPTTEFAEIWNLTRSISGRGGWVLAGIQQTS